MPFQIQLKRKNGRIVAAMMIGEKPVPKKGDAIECMYGDEVIVAKVTDVRQTSISTNIIEATEL